MMEIHGFIPKLFVIPEGPTEVSLVSLFQWNDVFVVGAPSERSGAVCICIVD